MLYLQGNQHWIREELLPFSLGDPPGKSGVPADPNAKRVNNGIIGDARRSSYDLGKRFVDLKIEYGVEQIQELLKAPATPQGQ
jgi:hypothetical protein